MKITTWNVNQFCGNKSWKIKQKQKEQIWNSIKEKVFDRIKSFLKNDEDILFLDEVPVADSNKKNELSNIYSDFIAKCKSKGYEIFDSSDDNQSTIKKDEKFNFKTIALCKKSGVYNLGFGDKEEEYYKYMKNKFKFSIECYGSNKGKTGDVVGTYLGNDYFRTIVIKNNKNQVFLGIHVPSEMNYENMLIKSYFHNLKLLIDDIKAKYGDECRIVCCGDINIYNKTNPNYYVLDQFLKNNKLEDARTKDDERGMTHKYYKEGKCYKNRIDRIFISNSIENDYKLYIDGKNVEDRDYDVEHKNFIVNEELGLELSDHYPLSIEK